MVTNEPSLERRRIWQTKTAERLWSGTSQLGYDYVYVSDYENQYEHNPTYKILIQIHFKKQFIYPQGGD